MGKAVEGFQAKFKDIHTDKDSPDRSRAGGPL